jgi:hypothetical protein
MMLTTTRRVNGKALNDCAQVDLYILLLYPCLLFVARHSYCRLSTDLAFASGVVIIMLPYTLEDDWDK